MKQFNKMMIGMAVLSVSTLGMCANLIVNPGFEDEFSASYPDMWRAGTGNRLYITDGTPGADTHTGIHSIAITNLPNAVWWYATSDGKFSVSGLDIVRFTAWVKTEGLDGDDYVQLRLQPFNSSGEALPRKDGAYFQINSDWQQISWVAVLSADAAEVQPLLAVGDGANNSSSASSVVYFDDVSVTIIDP